jgi:hypothetical protein
MATYYKYAERSAESQINWAEIGKNMTDMLQQEVDIREQKKAAIDDATRKYAEELSNAPQGEHVGAREEALRFADDASQYMLIQERLLKQGLLKPRDYMIARQNLVDGTKKAFGSLKAFQANYGELMERAKTDTSSAIELKRLERVQGYGNFRESGFFIDAPSGNVNVGMKDYMNLDGKQVIGLKSGSTRGMQYIDGVIYGRVDKFKYLDPLTALSNTYGEEIRTSIADPATMSKIGTIKSISDLRQREDIDPATKKVLFHYITAVTNSVNALITNPLQRGSLLIDTMGYDLTDDPAEAAKDPTKVLEVIDPNTGRAELRFTKEQEQASTDFMVQQFLGMVDRKEDIRTMGQVQLQESKSKTEGEMAREDMEKESENFGRNLALLTTGTAAQKAQAARYFASIKGISGVEPTATGINIYEGSTALPYDFSVGGKESTPLELGGSIVKILNREGLSEDVILRAMKKNLVGGTITKDAVGRIGGVATDYAAEVGEYASKKVNEGVVIDNPKKTKANLEASLKDLGFSVSGRSSGMFNQNDFITITGPYGKSKEFAIDNSSNNAEIANFIRENRDDKKAQEIFGSKFAGGGGAPSSGRAPI